MKEERAIAIITARGGSKRIPGKNIKEFCGKPIISYSIEAALKSGVFDTVMVSTDSTEIAEIAKQYGAEVPFMRSESAANDFSTTSEVLLEVLSEYDSRKENYTYACCIYPTAPFVTPEKLRAAMQELKTSDSDTVIPVVAFSYPPQRGMIIEDEYVKLKNEEYRNSRSQDLEKMYHDCGQFYAFRTDSFKKTQNLMAGRIKPIVCLEMEVQDIDTLEDWKLAELKYRMFAENHIREESLRPAVQEDCDLLFRWANEPLVRRNSFHTESIPYEEHVEWFQKQLKRNDSRQFIYLDKNEPVGQIRITECEGEAELSYSIAREKRGRGYGERMIKLMCRQIQEYFPEVRKVKARVKPENTASQKALLQAGLKTEYITYELKLDEEKRI